LTDTKKKYVIGITAFTRASIANLLERIFNEKKDYEFTIISMINDLKINGIEVCEKNDLPEKIAKCNDSIVIGGTVWDWYKVRKTVECDIMMIDEGSQVSKKKK
jgi:DNA replication ATP-dependent helicase Dna2